MNISPERTPKEVFYEFINSSVISYVGAGSSGLGLRSSNPTNDNYKILTTNNENVACSELFIKIIPIFTDISIQPRFNDLHIRKTDQWADIFSSTEDEFWNEVGIQNEIYKKSNDNLEPICPPIVYSECLDNASSIEFLMTLFRKLDTSGIHRSTIADIMADDPLNKIASILKLERFRSIKLGIIGMGFTTGYQSLYSFIRGKNAAQKKPYLELAVYELLRLYSIGYLHGDFSLANIMINPTYNYTGAPYGRAMLIDFGMTFEHDVTDLDVSRILQRMLNTYVPFSQIVPKTHDNYKWLITYTTMYSGTLVASYNALRRSVSEHSTAMINMIETKYPDVLTQIRMYNATTENDNIFHGGLKNASQMEDVIALYIQNKMLDVKPESKSKTMSMLEFNHIFNPNNLNIPQLLDAYLRTLHLGEQSIKAGIKGVKDKMGGKKQKRSSRNIKKRKQKTKRRPVYRSKKSYKRHR